MDWRTSYSMRLLRGPNGEDELLILIVPRGNKWEVLSMLTEWGRADLSRVHMSTILLPARERLSIYAPELLYVTDTIEEAKGLAEGDAARWAGSQRGTIELRGKWELRRR